MDAAAAQRSLNKLLANGPIPSSVPRGLLGYSVDTWLSICMDECNFSNILFIYSHFDSADLHPEWRRVFCQAVSLKHSVDGLRRTLNDLEPASEQLACQLVNESKTLAFLKLETWLEALVKCISSL